MDSTLYRGIKLKAYKSVQMIIDFIISETRDFGIQKHLMFDLLDISNEPNLTLHRFFSAPKRNTYTLEWTNSLNIRKPLRDLKDKDKFETYSNKKQQIIVVNRNEMNKNFDREQFFYELREKRDKMENNFSEVHWAVSILEMYRK